MKQANLFESEQRCNCQRCGVRIRLDPKAGSKAKMLKRSAVPKGLCLNCAMHDWLRNTYPVNLLLAQGGPRALSLPHIQEMIAGIMKSQFSDAAVDEIDFDAVIENWDLPFPNKLKRSPRNPVDQAELERAKKEGVPVYGADAEEQLKEQQQKAIEVIRRIDPDSEIVIE